MSPQRSYSAWTAVRSRRRAAWIAFIGVLLTGDAIAQTSEIQVYDASIAEPGHLDLTLHNNYVVQGSRLNDPPGAIVPEHSLTGGSEWAYGVEDWMEFGVYLPIYTLTRGHSLLYDGSEWRVLLVSPDAADRNFYYGANFALQFSNKAYDRTSPTAEFRPIVGMRLQRVHITFNPIIETEFRAASKISFSPAERIDYLISKTWSVAVEDYAELGSITRSNNGGTQRNSVFAVGDYRMNGWSLEAGLGVGLTRTSERRTFKMILSHDFSL